FTGGLRLAIARAMAAAFLGPPFPVSVLSPTMLHANVILRLAGCLPIGEQPDFVLFSKYFSAVCLLPPPRIDHAHTKQHQYDCEGFHDKLSLSTVELAPHAA